MSTARKWLYNYYNVRFNYYPGLKKFRKKLWDACEDIALKIIEREKENGARTVSD
jgi:hypothetical protein